MSELIPGAEARGYAQSIVDRAFLEIIRDNRRDGQVYVLKYDLRLGRLSCTISWRSSKNPFGRFGAGWNWRIGVQWSKRSWLFSLLVMEVRISILKPEVKNGRENPKLEEASSGAGPALSQRGSAADETIY
jgi:hypothetical protein